MRGARTAGALLVLLAPAAVLAQAGGIAWEADYDLALKAAKEDRKPIMIAFIMDGERANDDVVKVHFENVEVIAASRGFHCLVASVGVHAATSAEGTCPRFHRNTCASHQRVQMRAQTEHLQSLLVSAPQFLFLDPDATTVLVRHVWVLPPAELVRKMTMALAFAGSATGIDEAARRQKEEVTRLLAQAESKDAHERFMALARLAELDDPRIVDFLIRQTGDEAEDARRVQAIDAMGRRGNAKALPQLVKLLKARVPNIRARSAIALEKLGMIEASEAIRAAMRTDLSDRVRGNLVRALAACDPGAPDTVKAILGMIDSGTPKERVAAIRASFDVAASDALAKALLRAAAHPSVPLIRGAAYCALAHHQVADAVPVLEKAAARETLPDMKVMARSALAALTGASWEGPSGLDALRRYLPDEQAR